MTLTAPVIPAPSNRHSRGGGNPRLPRTPIRGPGLSGQTVPQHNRHSRAHQPSFPRRREPTPVPDSDPGARTLRADRAPTQPSFPRPPTVIPAQAGTHACPGLRSGGPDSRGRPCPNTSVIPTPLPPSFPRRREPTPAPDSDPGARTLRADRAPTHPSFPRPPTVIPTPHPPSFPRRREPTPAPDSDPGARTLRQVTSAIGTPPPTVTPAQAGTTPAPDSDPGARTTRQFATAPLSSRAPPHGQRP